MFHPPPLLFLPGRRRLCLLLLLLRLALSVIRDGFCNAPLVMLRLVGREVRVFLGQLPPQAVFVQLDPFPVLLLLEELTDFPLNRLFDADL